MLAVRFFRVVPLHSTYMLVGLAALGVFGLVTLSLDPGSGMDVTVPVLLLQAFAVSSGFAVPARRGNFDLLLTGGATRRSVALVHWAMSAAPGILVWLFLAGVEWAVAGRPGAALSNGTIAALFLISTLGWAVTVPLPRMSGGVVWLVALVIVVAASEGWQQSLQRITQGGAGNMELAVVFLICPWLLVGNTLAYAQFPGVLPGLALAATAMAVAVAWINRADIALEAAQ